MVKPNQFRIKVGGSFGFKNIDEATQRQIKERLAEKDEVLGLGMTGVLPGIKIDGRVVTKDNIHTFEKPANPLDINRDGAVDAKDASLAGRVLAESKKAEKVAVVEPSAEPVVKTPAPKKVVSVRRKK